MFKKLSIKIIMILSHCGNRDSASSMYSSRTHSQNQDMQEVLNIHNRERTEVNFPVLTWSDSLAADAQKWADHLTTPDCKRTWGMPNLTLPTVLQMRTIASGYVYPAELGRTSPAEFAQMWADEKVA